MTSGEAVYLLVDLLVADLVNLLVADAVLSPVQGVPSPAAEGARGRV